jgi:TBCC domain-containing protein 1
MISDMAMLIGDSLECLSSASPSIDDILLTAKPHPFGEVAVLSPKHAQEMSPTLFVDIASSRSEQSYGMHVVPYTLWITEAYREGNWSPFVAGTLDFT